MTILSVTGMTCDHCKTNIEKFVSKIENVEKVIAYPSENKVEIEGNPDIEEVIEVIEDLGYKVKD